MSPSTIPMYLTAVVLVSIINSSTSSSIPSSSLESSVHSQHQRRRSVPFTYGITSETVDMTIDICTITEEEKGYYTAFYLSLSTGKLDGLTGPSKARICHYQVIRVPIPDDFFVEISFSKNPDKNENACFTIEGEGMSQKSYEPNCRTDGAEKVFFREKANGADLTISMTETNLRNNLNFQLMIRHLPEKIQPETLNIIGDLRLKCDHPNELLKPSLYKEGADLTAKLEEPEKRVYTAEYDLKGNVQGRYTCSWDDKRSEDAVFLVNVYAPTINCSMKLDGKEETPDGQKLGDYLVVYRDSEDILGRLEFECLLSKATMDGTPDGALGWEDSTEEELKDVRKEAKREEIRASFSRNIRSDFIEKKDLKDVTYMCSIDHTDSRIDFKGGEPKACSIKIIVEETNPNPKTASMTYIGIGIAVVVLIIIVVVIFLFWRRSKGTHDTTAGDHVSNHSSLNDYQTKDDVEAEKKFARPGILKNKGGDSPRLHTGKHRRPQITGDVIRDVKTNGVKSNGKKANGELTDDETTYNSRGSHDADAGSAAGSRLLEVSEEPECDAGRLSWDPSGDELTSMPYKEELAQALSRRPKEAADDDDDDDDDVSSSEKSGVKPADSKSSFLGFDYEEVILPDDAVSVDSDAVEEKKSAAERKTTGKAPGKLGPAKKGPEKKSPRQKGPEVIYTPVDKRKKTNLNNETKRQGKTTEI